MIHVLPGDAIAEKFELTGIPGEVVICRESLIEGDARATDPDDFWRRRARYFRREYGENEFFYQTRVVSEFRKLIAAGNDRDIFLWFENELFCQVNFWFCLYLLKDAASARVHRVAPFGGGDHFRNGFGRMTVSGLRGAFDRKVLLQLEDRVLGHSLWEAFAEKNFTELFRLGQMRRPCFPKLFESVLALAEMDKQTRSVLREILEELGTNGDFRAVFARFSRRTAIYGLGDRQVKRLLKQVGASSADPAAG